MDSRVSMETGGGPTVTNLSMLGGKREQGGFSRAVPLLRSPSCSQLCVGSGFVSVGEILLSPQHGCPKPSLNGENLIASCPAPPAACLPHPRACEGTGTPQSNHWPFLDHNLPSAWGGALHGLMGSLGAPFVQTCPQ